MSDVRLFQTNDGGDIELTQDSGYVDVVLDLGLETAAYLSLFGGNMRDPGIEKDDSDPEDPHSQEWWGNLEESEVYEMESEAQYVLESMPATSANLVRLEQAAARDLEWMKEHEIAREIEVSARLLTVNTVGLSARIVVHNKELVYEFSTTWGN